MSRDDDEMVNALALLQEAMEGLVVAQIEHEKSPDEETAEKCEAKDEAVDSAVDHCCELIREDLEKESPPPYNGYFR